VSNRRVLLTLVLAACSSKATTSGDSARSARELGTASQAETPSGTPAAPALPPPDPREAALSATVRELLTDEHLLRKPIDDSVSRDAFKTYLDRLDGTKMFLLASDRDALAKYADKVDDELRSGRLDLAHDGAKVFAQRVGVVEKMVESLLAAPLDLTNEESVEVDPDKLQPAASEAELKDRWRQRLELEVLERIGSMEDRLAAEAKKKDAKGKDKAKAEKEDKDAKDASATPLAQIPTTPEGREAKAREDLTKTYAGRFARLKTQGPLDAASDLVNAVTSSLDPHSTYLPPADKANFDIAITGSLEGIGAVLREKDHYIEISELVPGGASWRHGGIVPGDLILAVTNDGKDPVDVYDMRIDEVVKMIRGPKGTVVRLRVQKSAGTEATVAITRDKVEIEEAYAKGAVINHKSGPSFGYIHLPSFYGGKGNGQRTAASDVKRLLDELEAKKVAGVVIDLRSNGGGLLYDAVEMTGSLIDKGPVVQVQDSRGRKEVLRDEKAGLEYTGPVVVLVDKFSASASEIFAGAMQDYGRAVIVGTGPTHGKGTVQTLADLDRATGGKVELGVLKLTIQQFFRVTGASTQREGVVPDIVLPDPAGHVDAGERSLDHALEWSKIDGLPYDKVPHAWKADQLAQKSGARIAKDPLLSKIAATTQVLRARRHDTKIPLAKPAWEARRKEQKAALEAVSPDVKTLPPRLTVKPLDDGKALPPGPGAKTDDRGKRWSDGIARDPWIDESVNVLADMAKSK
jgi:carboxyl-terminal processing protease